MIACSLCIAKAGTDLALAEKVLVSLKDDFYKSAIQDVGDIVALEWVAYDMQEALNQIGQAQAKVQKYLPHADIRDFTSPIL